MALPWILKNYLRIGGGRLTGPLTLEGGESAEGVDSSGSAWIRFKSGLQICWTNNNYTYPTTVTYPQPFKDLPGVAVDNPEINATSWGTTGCLLITVTGNAPVNTFCSLIAIGFWK